mmetsp:Transcript_36732/g.88274  ORF Transcript_36732/g.88274 Transcript_36732/m.88274 type:complete len:211 (-) Transcript_36732:18-650(-)
MEVPSGVDSSQVQRSVGAGSSSLGAGVRGLALLSLLSVLLPPRGLSLASALAGLGLAGRCKLLNGLRPLLEVLLESIVRGLHGSPSIGDDLDHPQLHLHTPIVAVLRLRDRHANHSLKLLQVRIQIDHSELDLVNDASDRLVAHRWVRSLGSLSRHLVTDLIRGDWEQPRLGLLQGGELRWQALQHLHPGLTRSRGESVHGEVVSTAQGG